MAVTRAMDIEFHYYITYLIAARARFAPADAYLIAHSAQGVDDNHIPVRIEDASGVMYQNNISQTMDIIRPHEDLLIYPIFHFIPGEINAPSAARVDGRTDPWVTTPNSPLANEMIDAALASNDLYRIGVSAHGYVDTWAHQNFLGKRDTFNEFTGGLLSDIVNMALAVGHARAKHLPDWPALTWQDTRLAEPTVDNKVRFIDAARHLYGKFARHARPALSQKDLDDEANALVTDLEADIGPPDDLNAHVGDRIERYMARSLSPEYGGVAIPAYSEGQWFAEAIQEDRDTVEAKAKLVEVASTFADVEGFLKDFYDDMHRQTVRWRDPSQAVYSTYHWYRFQEAVKAHLQQCAGFLQGRGLLPTTSSTTSAPA